MSLPSGLVEDKILESLINYDDLVGQGTTRIVYGVVGYPDYVIKVSLKPFHYANFVEWTIWHAVGKMADDILGNEPNSELRELFAKADSISHSAKFLLMERLQNVKQVTTTDLQSFPHWLNDRKPSAFGTDKSGQIKVMDYAMIDFYRVLNPRNISTPI